MTKKVLLKAGAYSYFSHVSLGVDSASFTVKKNSEFFEENIHSFVILGAFSEKACLCQVFGKNIDL